MTSSHWAILAISAAALMACQADGEETQTLREAALVPADVGGSPVPRAALRPAALGCWALAGMADEPTTAIVQLDSALVPGGETGQRMVRRYRANGAEEPHVDFPNNDWWSADLATSKIRLALHGPYYGSDWVLLLPDTAELVNIMHGSSRAYSDVYVDLPVRTVSATRVPCSAASDEHRLVADSVGTSVQAR